MELCPLETVGSQSEVEATNILLIFDNQAVELLLDCAALNHMILFGKPDTYVVEDRFINASKGKSLFC